MVNIGEIFLKRREAKEFFKLEENYSLYEIKKTYRQLALQNHPDKNLQFSKEKTREMAKINELYQILLSPETYEEEYIKQFYEGFVI